MNKTGIILAILLLLTTLQSTFFFLGVLKVKFVEWVFFNACAPSNITYLVSGEKHHPILDYTDFKERLHR